MLSIIVAIDKNNAIGRKGDLLCHLPNDLAHFKALTTGKTVLMGKRTYFSLPRHPLPNRRNIVISDLTGEKIEGAEVAYSLEQALALTNKSKETFVIGGGMVYRQMLPLADRLYITHIDFAFEGADTFFPLLDPEQWVLQSEEKHAADERNPYPYTFALYQRRNAL